MNMSTTERFLSLFAALIAIFAFVTGIQSLKQSHSAPTATTNSVAAAVTDPSGFTGSWDGYLSSYRQILDKAGKVVGDRQYYEDNPSEEVFVTQIAENQYEVTHRYKDGSHQDKGIYSLRDGKLIRDGTPYDYYKGTIPTIWRTPDGTLKYIDGVSELRLSPRQGSNPESFLGLWLIKSDSIYLKISRGQVGAFELSQGTGDHGGEYAQILADGIRWLPPEPLQLKEGVLRGSPPDSLGGHLTLAIVAADQLKYTLDFGGGNTRTLQATRILDLRSSQ